MLKDSRYTTARILFEEGKIRGTTDILKVIPVEVLAKDLNMPIQRLSYLIEEPGNFKAKQIVELSELLEVDLTKLLHILGDEFVANSKKNS